MLEIRYNTGTKKINAWCADPDQFGNLDRGMPDEAVIILAIEIPTDPSDAYLVDDVNFTLVFDPDYSPYVDPDTIRAQELLDTSPDAITAPKMWELMRIFGRRLGFTT
ncbi:hypothetical protein ES708_10252 [subsurface metagenome]